MADDHLKLSYRLISRHPRDTIEVKPAVVELAGFTCRLAGDHLEAEAPDGVDDELTARERLQPELDGWALRLELDRHLRAGFRFEGASRPPGIPRANDLTANATLAVAASAALDLHTSLALPNLQPGYRRSDIIDAAVNRLRGVEDGFEPVTSAAYWLTTLVKSHYTSEPAAAAALKVSANVIATMRNFSTRQDPAIGRKVERAAAALRADDVAWLTGVMRELVRRLAAAESGIDPGAELTLGAVPTAP